MMMRGGIAVLILATLGVFPAGANPAAVPQAALPTVEGMSAAPVAEWALDHEVNRNTYRVGPGDRFLLLLDGKSLRRLKLTVMPEGLLEWEGGIREQVTGLSLRETEARLREVLAPLMPEVELSLYLLEPRRIDVHVLGEVSRPGAVSLRASDRISSALGAAGGPAANGSRRFVEYRDGDRVTRLDLYPFQFRGDWDANPYCPSGTAVFVPLRRDTVQVVGEVNRPGTYEWSEGETLQDFLDYALGFTQDALTNSILLERDESDVITVLLDSSDGNLPLRPSDTIVVGSRKPLMNRVFLEGAGERLGEIYLSPGETLGDLVHRLGQTRGRALPDQAVLERRGTDRDKFMRFDLREVLRGDGPADLPIINDDVLYVPRRSSEVFVLGEVRKPGMQNYEPSRTVGQYLALAGGTSDRGSTRKLHVVDIEGVSRDVDTGDQLHRGDVIVVGRSNFSIFGELLLTAASVSGLILAINALAK
jgi:protein involved in polysaccharide export with SLBB domain